MQKDWPSLLKWWLSRLWVRIQKAFGKMIIKEEILIKKPVSDPPKYVVITGCGNSRDADGIMSSLIEIMNILKSEDITLITSDQSGIDFHVRSAANQVGVKTIIGSVLAMPSIYNRDSINHKDHYLSRAYLSGYRSIIIEGRPLDRINPFSEPNVVLVEGDDGTLSVKKPVKKTPTKKTPTKRISRRTPDAIPEQVLRAGVAITEALEESRADNNYDFSEEIHEIVMAKEVINPEDPLSVSDDEAINEVLRALPNDNLRIRFLQRFSMMQEMEAQRETLAR